jgi:2-hydroxychromene-2-carboxylate isomerase
VTAPTVEFHFDFGSPNAYLSHLVIPAIEARTGARFTYVPVLLGGVFKATGNRSPGESLAGIRNKPEFQALETRRFLARHGITSYRFNPFFPVNTLMLMRIAAGCEVDGTLAPYVEAAFHHMWEDPKKMDDPEIAKAAFDSSGLDGERLLARAQEPDAKARLLANTEASVARGTFGSPTFFVGTEMFFGKDQLRDVEEEIARAAAR